MNKFIIGALLLCFPIVSFSGQLINVKISNKVKAAEFDKKYQLVFPVHDYKNIVKVTFDWGIPAASDTSHIYFMDVYGHSNKIISSIRQKESSGLLSMIWMMPLSHNSSGFLYRSNDRLVNYKYGSGIHQSFLIGKEFPEFDIHCVITDDDTTYYYATTKTTLKKINGIDTLIADFDFWERNITTDSSVFLFSASQIIPDSFLVPQLFEARGKGLYQNLDIYHWNWMQKTGPSRLLLNFAYCGFMEIDIKTKKILWHWGYAKNSFTQMTGGDLNKPFYTHCLNKIQTGPYAGAYSYFENGGSGALQFDDTIIDKISRGCIFMIDTLRNTVSVKRDILFDPALDKDVEAHSMALGSVHVLDNYILVNLGMNIPIKKLMEINESYGKDSTLKYWKSHAVPKIFLYDLSGKEIAKYTLPYGVYSYSAWIRRKP